MIVGGTATRRAWHGASAGSNGGDLIVKSPFLVAITSGGRLDDRRLTPWMIRAAGGKSGSRKLKTNELPKATVLKA
jgi:hypothetical protein